MHLHHINDLIQLQDVTVSNYHISEDHVLFLSLCPTKSKQPSQHDLHQSRILPILQPLHYAFCPPPN